MMLPDFYRLKIQQDTDPSDPREMETPATILCWHRRYTIGDKEGRLETPIASMKALIEAIDPNFAGPFDEWREKELAKLQESGKWADSEQEYNSRIEAAFNRYFVWLPIYMYDHSGITIRTTSFNDRWDSGRVGFIYISKREAQREGYGGFDPMEPDHIDQETGDWMPEGIKAVEQLLKQEVEAYDQYLRGDIYGFVMEKVKFEFEIPRYDFLTVDPKQLPWEDVDSCWGFYGIEKNGMEDHFGPTFQGLLARAKQCVGEWVYQNFAKEPNAQAPQPT